MKNTLELTKKDGSAVSVRLRKVNPNHLSIIADPATKPEEQTALFIHPEGRSVDEQRAFIEELDDESLTEIYFAGWELNSENLDKFLARSKKLRENSGEQEFMNSPVFQNLIEKIAGDELKKSFSTGDAPTETSSTDSPPVATVVSG